MRVKRYPYLDNPYSEDANTSLENTTFLSKIDSFVNQKQYYKITLLTWDEEPIREIGGDLATGTITKDGSSSVRRTCQFTATVDTQSYDVTDLEMDFSINKKVFLEVGVKNYTKEYTDYPILWFPQGVFVISTFSCSSSSSTALNISISLKDKMALLNGECGGTIPAPTILDEEDTQDQDTGEWVTSKVLVWNIIQEVVNHFGNEPLENIVIEDVPLRIKRLVRWYGDTPLYICSTGVVDGRSSYLLTLEKPGESSTEVSTLANLDSSKDEYLTATQGDDIGYVYDDFVYDSDLTVNGGESVVTILDKIKSYLGNYEYFYDVYGLFHFREIKNYLNTTQATDLKDDMSLKDYLADTTIPKYAYSFSDDTNIISISSTPSYSNIKNDYIIQGVKKAEGSDVSYAIRYHLAIDKKPTPVTIHSNGTFDYNTYNNILIYLEDTTEIQKAIIPVVTTSLPDWGEFNSIYYIESENKAYYWNSTVWKEIKVVSFGSHTAKDWHDELYMRGLVAQKNGTDEGYYFAELEDSWPQIYDLANNCYYGQEQSLSSQRTALASGYIYLDFIDTSTPLGNYSVDAIGRRTDYVYDEDINCLFEPTFPDVVYLNLGLRDELTEAEFAELRTEAEKDGYPWCQVDSSIYADFATGGYNNAAYDTLCLELVQHTVFATTVSLTTLPVWYLEPNSRVQLNDKATNTFGDFMINSITIPLGAGGTMSLSLSQCLKKM